MPKKILFVIGQFRFGLLCSRGQGRRFVHDFALPRQFAARFEFFAAIRYKNAAPGIELPTGLELYLDRDPNLRASWDSNGRDHSNGYH